MSEVVALAFGIAASPFPILPAVLLLFSARPRATAFAFLGTWFACIAMVTALFALLSGAIGPSAEPAPWLVWVRIVAGIGLVGLAIQQWVTRPQTPRTPNWMQALEDATPRSAAVLALLLSVANPKVLLLAAVGGVDIGGAEWVLRQQAIAIAAFALIASVSVAGPIVAFVLGGSRVLGPLARLKDWLLRYNTAVLVVVFTVLGMLLIINGVGDL